MPLNQTKTYRFFRFKTLEYTIEYTDCISAES